MMLRIQVSAPRDGANAAIVAHLGDAATLAGVVGQKQVELMGTSYTNGEGTYGLTIHVLPDAPDPLETARAKLTPAELNALKASLVGG